MFYQMQRGTVAKGEEKAEVLNAFFPSAFNSMPSCHQGTQPPELDREQKEAPIIQRNSQWPAVSLRHPQVHGAGWDPARRTEGAGSSDHHLPAVLANWEVPADWKPANVTHTYKKGWKEHLGNYRPVSLISVMGKVMEEIILQTITQCIGQPGDQV